MENTLVSESPKLPTATEYRVRDGKIEARMLDGGPLDEADWTQVSSEQLSSHVLSNTAVARWLERNLGWRRLLRACVGEEQNEVNHKRDDRTYVCH
jgi:hypothetical protein